MREFDVPETGTALADPELKKMFQAYDNHKSSYFVILQNNSLFGWEQEFQNLRTQMIILVSFRKCIFSIEARGKGLGSLMIDLCLKSAIEHGFEKCYIETMHNMNKGPKIIFKKRV